MQVRHILQIKGRDIIGVADSATLSEAAHILAQHHIGALIIEDSGGALAGIFTERDRSARWRKTDPFRSTAPSPAI